MSWSCTITIGDDLTDDPHVWEVLEDPADVPDVAQVLDDLRFSWSLPKGLWPAQPDAMVADLSLSLPAFYDYSDIVRGARLAIEFRLLPSHLGPVVATYYGRITDAVAQPRDTTPGVDQPGVTLDITAVDYTADTLEPTPIPLIDPTPGAVFDEVAAVQAGFGACAGGYLPVTGGPFPDVWTSPNYNDVSPEQAVTSPRGLIDQMLLEAVNMDASPPTRMILAPLIEDGQVPDTRTMTLDTVTNEVDLDSPTFTLDADNLDIGIKWTSIKGQKPDYVTVTAQSGEVLATAPGPVVPPSFPDASKRVTLSTVATLFPYGPLDYGARAQDIGDFYARNNSVDDPWTLDQVRVFLDTLDDAQVAAFPVNLFPRWSFLEGDPDRASCYNLAVLITNIQPTVMPTAGATDVAGLLAGAELRLVDSRPELTLTLRYNQIA